MWGLLKEFGIHRNAVRYIVADGCRTNDVAIYALREATEYITRLERDDESDEEGDDSEEESADVLPQSTYVERGFAVALDVMQKDYPSFRSVHCRGHAGKLAHDDAIKQ